MVGLEILVTLERGVLKKVMNKYLYLLNISLKLKGSSKIAFIVGGTLNPTP